jgi:hypothetical protein
LRSTNLKVGLPCFHLLLGHKITHLTPITHVQVRFFLFFYSSSRLAPILVAAGSPPERSILTLPVGGSSLLRSCRRAEAARLARGALRHDLAGRRAPSPPWRIVLWEAAGELRRPFLP